MQIDDLLRGLAVRYPAHHPGRSARGRLRPHADRQRGSGQALGRRGTQLTSIADLLFPVFKKSIDAAATHYLSTDKQRSLLEDAKRVPLPN